MWGAVGMTLNEELHCQMSACLKRTYISVIHITYEEIQPSSYENQPVEKVDNFQRNAQGSHLVFHNEANFTCTEAYLSMKISCKFGEASCFLLRVFNVANLSTSGSTAKAKPKYPRSGYN